MDLGRDTAHDHELDSVPRKRPHLFEDTRRYGNLETDFVAGRLELFELGRIGGRRREEGLTPAERRVAVLVAEGRTNREVAAALFVTERTVASHLSHVYAKLGVRSRTELARQLR